MLRFEQQMFVLVDSVIVNTKIFINANFTVGCKIQFRLTEAMNVLIV